MGFECRLLSSRLETRLIRGFINTVTYLDAGGCVTVAMALPFKRRNEEKHGKTIQKGGSKADQRRPLAGGAFRLSFPCKSSVVIPGTPSARLTHGLKLNTGQRLLRFSYEREPHGPSDISNTPCVTVFMKPCT